MDDRGVSEVVGFVLVFSVITMTIGIVSVVGLGGLQDAQQAEQVNNVERAFDVLDDNFAKVQSQQAPSRTTELKLLDGSIGLGEEIEITVRVDGEDQRTIVSRPIVYSVEDTSIAYEGGAVFRTDGESSVMLIEPNHIYQDDRIVLPLAITDGDQDRIGGGGTVLIAGEGQYWTVDDDYNYPSKDVQLVIESPRAQAWGQYLDEIDGLSKDSVEDEKVVYNVESQLVVHRTRIGITLYR